MEDVYIERLRKEFSEHTFEAIPVQGEERTWQLKVDGNLFSIRWSQEAEHDLKAYHPHIHIEDELYSLIRNELIIEWEELEKKKGN